MKTSLDFVASSAALRPKKLVPHIFTRVLASKRWRDINKNAISKRRSTAKVIDFLAFVSLKIECLLFDFVGRKEVLL